MLAGRDFTDQDDAGAPSAAIVNEAFATRFWPGQEALGRRFRARGEWRTVVAVARNGKYNRLDEPSRCFFYLPYHQYVPDLDLSICVRTSGPPLALAKAVQQTVRDLDPALSVLGTTTMTHHTGTVLFAEQIASRLLAFLGTVGLILASLGVYSVMACAVGHRTQEFGVRIALGARSGEIVQLVIRQALVLAAAGLAFGVAIALAVTRFLASFLFGVSPFDLATFVGVPLVLGALVLLAGYVPARRATRVDPVIALRAE